MQNSHEPGTEAERPRPKKQYSKPRKTNMGIMGRGAVSLNTPRRMTFDNNGQGPDYVS